MARRPKITVMVTERFNNWKKTAEVLKKAKRRPHVKIGVQGNLGSSKKKGTTADGTEYIPLDAPTVAQIATMHEFGGEGGKPPERSFLRATMDKNKEKYIKAADELRSQIMQGKLDIRRALSILGLLIVTDVKKYIRAGITPPLAESTIRRKNHRQIAAAEANVSRLEKVMAKKGKLTASQKKSLNRSSEIILTGGRSTPLIDTGQLINSITSVVDMGQGSGGESNS